jgi:hypothetical protein
MLDAMMREAGGAPDANELALSAAPTPSHGPIEIAYSTRANREPPRVRVVDVAGRVVREIQAGSPGGGRFAVWDGRDDSGLAAAAGIYFVRLEQGESSATRRIVLLR